MTADVEAFVLTRHARDTAEGVEVTLWLASSEGPLQVCFPAQRAVCFIPQQQVELAQSLVPARTRVSFEPKALKDAAFAPVCACYFTVQRDLRAAARVWKDSGVLVYEADVRAADRFLMERFVRGGAVVSAQFAPQGRLRRAVNARLAPADAALSDVTSALRVVSLDIETAIDRVELFSIGVYAEAGGRIERRVFMARAGENDALTQFCGDQVAAYRAFVAWLDTFDPDVIIGWNVVNFDLNFLSRWCEIHNLVLGLGRDASPALWLGRADDTDRRQIQLHGRVVLDGIDWLKQAGYSFERYGLESVAQNLLGEGKLLTSNDRGEEIERLFHADPLQLAEYNNRDCELVWKIFAQTALIDFAVARSQLTGLALGRIGGSVAAFDFRYLPLLHRAGFVAPDQQHGDLSVVSPGGYVMESQPGLYDSVVVLDFKSLYPSIIRSFLIDPLALVLGSQEGVETVEGFEGARFARDAALLPDLIAELWQARDAAKRDNNRALDLAVKILMNSFYGVLGSPGCRFFDPRLASSITRRGHQIIQQSRSFIEARGYPVIYGDTDSLFVWLKHRYPVDTGCEIAQLLANDINHYWRERLQSEFGLESALEIKFETHYRKFFMPTIRGSEEGSKKRYAGMVETRDVRGMLQQELIFKGLESARSDWTPLAKRFQRELYRRVFCDEPFDDYIRQIVADVHAGACDGELTYRKRLRAPLESYQRNVPPHVQAARRLQAAGIGVRRGEVIEYIVCRQGALPQQLLTAKPDYAHYVEKQLRPIADSILQFVDASFARLTERQINLF